jgi:hypothetical protein
MITLTLRGEHWMARWTGPEAALVRDAFGTDEIPTPYTAASDPALVLRAIAGRNPRHEVRIAGECHWCGTVTTREHLLCVVCGESRGLVCAACHALLAGPCDGCAHPDDCVCDVCGNCPDCDNGTSGPVGTYCKRCHRTQRP